MGVTTLMVPISVPISAGKVTRDNQIVTLTASAICVSCCKCWKTNDRPWIHGWSEWPG